MSASGKKGKSGNGNNTPNSDEPQPSAGSASSTVRDFIYLDEAKIFSYLAQIEGGLRLVRQEVESALDTSRTESGGDKKGGSHNFEGEVSPAAAALAQALTAFLSAGTATGLLTGAGGKYTYQREWEKSTDKLLSETRDLTASTDLTVLHHAAFDVVMSHLSDRVKTAKGALTLLPLSSLVRSFGNALAAGLPVDTPDASGGVAAVGAYSELGTQTVVFLESQDNLHAYVQDSNFIVSPSLLLATYGACTSENFTIVYIEAQDTRR